MIYKYTWIETGETFACRCGGTVRGYRVEPPRSRLYLNNVFVCDSPLCRESKATRKNGELLEGRLLLAG